MMTWWLLLDAVVFRLPFPSVNVELSCVVQSSKTQTGHLS